MIYGYCTNAAFYLSQKLNVGAGNDVGLCIGKNQAIRYIVIFLILGKPPQYKNTRGGNDDRIESVHLVVWSLNVAHLACRLFIKDQSFVLRIDTVGLFHTRHLLMWKFK